MKKINFAGKLLASLLLLLSLSSVSLASFPTESVNGSMQTITMSTAQFSKLKLTISELEMNLNELEKNSKADKEELKTLSEQLNDCKNQLILAETSLGRANNSLTALTNNLQTLKLKIDNLQHKLKVKERQNDLAWIVAASFFAWGVSK